NLNRVWLHVYEYNARAIGVYEKVGFRIEGRLRQDTFRDGGYWDTVVMGILHEEWQAAGGPAGRPPPPSPPSPPSPSRTLPRGRGRESAGPPSSARNAGSSRAYHE